MSAASPARCSRSVPYRIEIAAPRLHAPHLTSVGAQPCRSRVCCSCSSVASTSSRVDARQRVQPRHGVRSKMKLQALPPGIGPAAAQPLPYSPAPAVALTAAALALCASSLASHGANLAACAALLRHLTLSAALCFGLYLVAGSTSVSAPIPAPLEALRPTRVAMLQACAFLLALPYLAALVWAASAFPSALPSFHLDVVPFTLAAVACAGVLALSEAQGMTRQLKGRVIFELEAGAGMAHPVMAQGGRLAMRNYLALWLPLALGLDAFALLRAGQTGLAMLWACAVVTGAGVGAWRCGVLSGGSS